MRRLAPVLLNDRLPFFTGPLAHRLLKRKVQNGVVHEESSFHYVPQASFELLPQSGIRRP